MVDMAVLEEIDSGPHKPLVFNVMRKRKSAKTHKNLSHTLASPGICGGQLPITKS